MESTWGNSKILWSSTEHMKIDSLGDQPFLYQTIAYWERSLKCSFKQSCLSTIGVGSIVVEFRIMLRPLLDNSLHPEYSQDQKSCFWWTIASALAKACQACYQYISSSIFCQTRIWTHHPAFSSKDKYSSTAQTWTHSNLYHLATPS